MNEQPNMLAYDALRLAVDLNTSEKLVLDSAATTRRWQVLKDAEEFYEWLKDKQE